MCRRLLNAPELLLEEVNGPISRLHPLAERRNQFPSCENGQQRNKRQIELGEDLSILHV